MDTDFINDLIKNNFYILVVGYWMGHFLYLIIMDYFDRSVERIAVPVDTFHKLLLYVIAFLCLFTWYRGEFACFAVAFYIAGLWLWYRGYFAQYGTKYRQRLYLQKRFNIYCALTDEDLLIEELLFRIDKQFGGVLTQLTRLFKIIMIPLFLVMVFGEAYIALSNHDLGLPMIVLQFFYRSPGEAFVLLNGVILLVVCWIINYTELQTRRQILEYLLDVKNIKIVSSLKNTHEKYL